MLIDDVIAFCNKEYQNSECIPCSAKNTCELECGENCKICLDDIHFHHHIYRDEYDCERLLDYYMCRYSYKYCSELIYALRELDLSRYPYFHILSLGCGGAPDLMAFEYMQYEQKISYCGYDRNVYWEKIHSYIEKNFSGGNVKFRRDVDVLTHFEAHEIHRCNVIIIQYLISFFYDTIGKIGLRNWFSRLAQNIVQFKPPNSPMLIIINDADSINTGRDALPLFVKEIENVGLEVSMELRRRFKEHNYYEHSVKYRSKKNVFEDEIDYGFSQEYCTAINCESAQLILETNYMKSSKI